MAERVHGGIDARVLRALSVDPGAVVDFSVNLNPYGPNERVLRAAREAALDRYPDPGAHAAREAWADTLGCSPDALAVGHGAADLFWAIVRAAVRGTVPSAARVVIAEPTFSEFAVAAAAGEARVERVRADEASGLRLDLGALARHARGAAALYLCSPNNPTGEYLPLPAVRALAEALPDTLLVLDQSFVGLTDHAADALVALPDNVVRVRSLTKEFACPGLRIGLCVATPAWIARIEAQRPTWATSSPALAALAVSAREHSFVADSWQQMRADREATRGLLVARGLTPLPSATSYQLVPVPMPASELWQRLARQGVLVRDCTSFGLPRHVRVAALPAAARARLGAALDVVLRA
jgi:histidinol-phosphate/aromatic aminotransferase/cobyric acid decarboxylase-like protein